MAGPKQHPRNVSDAPDSNNLVFRGTFQNLHCRKMNKVPHCRFNVLCIAVYQLPKSFQSLISVSKVETFSVWHRKSEIRMLEKVAAQVGIVCFVFI